MKKYCTIQVDCDGLWVLTRLMGLEAAIEPDPVFELGMERLLGLLTEFGVKATFFVVAEDLKSQTKKDILKKIAQSGHEIASHGMQHRYLNAISEKEKRDEIFTSKTKIEDTLGVKVRGFKAAGFAVNKDASEMLVEAGYEYDSSVFGNSLAYLMELFSGISYPKWDMITSPSSPYRSSGGNIFKKGGDGIAEIPVTTLPLLRFPIHFSYAALGGKLYTGFIRKMLEARCSKFVNYLFHPLDMLDKSSVKIDANIYGLGISAESKMSMARDMLKFFKDQYDIVTSKEICKIAAS